MLVLGNENAGIRVEIIQLLDGCVEIRQHAWDNPCLVASVGNRNQWKTMGARGLVRMRYNLKRDRAYG